MHAVGGGGNYSADSPPILQSTCSAASVLGALTNVASLGKPVMLVPQAFGGGENWARGPSRQEERLMTYLGLLSGAKAIQVRFLQQ
jgi:hypothetical protein